MKKWGYRYIFGLPVLSDEALTHADSVLGWRAMLLPLCMLLVFCLSPFVIPPSLLPASGALLIWLGLYALPLVWFLRKSRVGEVIETLPDEAFPGIKKQIHRWSWGFGIFAALIISVVLSAFQYRIFGRAKFWTHGTGDTLFNMAWQIALIAWILEHTWRVALESRLVVRSR
ncbi:hypothetical protein [Lacticaseibacillus sp. N501-2]|uniref:hypothetical protein n=1 Tax=Lacticaseibacillus salsurae TaxID=3367729 RepID=UPI0038B3D45B